MTDEQIKYLASLLGKYTILGKATIDLLDALEYCHICGEELRTDHMTVTYCDGCSYDCEDHEGPECTPIYVLMQKCRKALDAD